MKVSDLCVGVCLVVVGLMVDGVMEIMGLEYIDWGYSSFEKKFEGFGVIIWCERMIDEEIE